MTIVRTAYRYKRPPRKRKAVALEIPAIKSAIVTAKNPHRRHADVPDMTPEEHKPRGDAADELMRRFKREIAATKRP